jgi:putative ABC transport system permease protein
MNFRTLIRRSLRFHWRSHLGVVLGAAVGSAALIGALVVGDSVRESLRERAAQRLGPIDVALGAGDRLVTPDLARKLSLWTGPAGKTYLPTNCLFSAFVEPVLNLHAVVSKTDGTARANRVNLYVGLRDFLVPYEYAGESVRNFFDAGDEQKGEIYLNEALAKHLGVSTGEELLMRVPKPTSMSPDAVIAPRNDQTIAVRLRVAGIVPADDLGDFALTPAATSPLNAFAAPSFLKSGIGLPVRANILTARWRWVERPSAVQNDLRGVLRRLGLYNQSGSPTEYSAAVDYLNHGLREVFSLNDAQAEIREMRGNTCVELRTSRVFLGPPLVRAASAADTNAQPILTYLVNLLRAGTNTTPYSMITAAGAPWTPAGMRDDEIMVSQWLADDLQVKPGDEIALTYFDPESGSRLAERTNMFRVRGVVPGEMPWADRTLMPDYPGIEKAESTSDWDAGFPLVHKIRQKDEDYWKQHRGTPKAFVTLAAGQKMWGNRFGELTAIRFPTPTNSVETHSTASQTSRSDGDSVERVPTNAPENYRATLEEKILATLKPEELGLRFEPVREQALKAAKQSQDFGGLFLGFSFFLIIAALLLMAMLFQFGLEQRTEEIGTFLALGFTPGQVRRLLLGEGVALAFIGGVLGALGGVAYARAMLHGLTTIWRDAVGSSALSFHATTQTLVIGLFASVVVSATTIWVTMRKFVRRPARELLVGEVPSSEFRVSSRGRLIGGVALVGAIGLVGWTLVKGDTANAGAFFGAGSLVLIAGLSFVSAWLSKLSEGRAPRRPEPKAEMSQGLADLDPPKMGFTSASLAIRGCARRRKRSVATVAMLACGSFLIVSIGVFRLDANRDATERSSGTGGFALIGETTMPVVQDLNSQSGRDFFALSERDLEGVKFVPFRVHEGDEASCLNLNRAQKPRLLGVKPEMLNGRFTFARLMPNTFVKTGEWSLLSKTSVPDRAPVERDEIPAIGDANSIQWAMHKKVGDTIDYVDERGQPFKVRIIGAVANSILQGQLIIDEAEFVKRFPGESGYRTFLIDAPSNSVAQVSSTLSRAMQDVGLELTPAAQRLAQFNAVQNTYLGTFQVLGGLGLLLGSVGLGIVVLRNVLERRGELALLMAVGFRARTVRRLLLIEHGALLAVGLGIGVVAAAVAVLASVLWPSASLPYQSLAVTLVAVLANGVLWTWVAARVALRGNLLAALRNE